MAKKITWWQAAEILVISDRHMRRWRQHYVEEGYNAQGGGKAATTPATAVSN